MPYLICDNCEIYYEIEDDFNLDCLDTCESCDNKLKLYNSFDDYYNNNAESQRESRIIIKLMLKRKFSKYSKLIVMGEIIGLIGLFGFIVTPLSLIILSIGAGLIFYGYNNSKSWNKGTIGKLIVVEYLNQLPKNYFIFNDVKFPGSHGNLDHVVIGPNGIFVIETKNYNDYYIINDNNWFYKSGRNLNKVYSNPGKQVMNNAMSLRKFLSDKEVQIDDIWIHSIVILLNNNFEFQKRPKYYEVLAPSQLPIFIPSIRKKIDQNILENVALLIEPYNIEIYDNTNL